MIASAVLWSVIQRFDVFIGFNSLSSKSVAYTTRGELVQDSGGGVSLGGNRTRRCKDLAPS